MKRRLLNLLSILSLPLCVAACVLWVRSFEGNPAGVTLDAGRWHAVNLRGRLWVIRHRPNKNPSFVRTTVHLGLSGPRPVALIKAVVFEPGARWDPEHGVPSELRARPYVLVNLPGGNDTCGFAAAAGRLPASVPGLERHGSVLQAVALPHWFLAALTAAAPAAWLRGRHLARRRARAGLCPRCGYDLRATPGRCPECGWSEAPANA